MLLAQGYLGRHDFAFIDADKSNYANYYAEWRERIVLGKRDAGSAEGQREDRGEKTTHCKSPAVIQPE